MRFEALALALHELSGFHLLYREAISNTARAQGRAS
jgi:hypothetical protein